MSEKKVIYTPEYFSLSKSKSKKKPKQRTLKKSSSVVNKSANKVRAKLLKKIKEFQKQKKHDVDITNKDIKSSIDDFDDEFNKSLSFLNTFISKKKKNKKKKDKSHKSDLPLVIDIKTEDSPVLFDNVNTTVSIVDDKYDISGGEGKPKEPLSYVKNTNKITIKNAPPYSSLKNGTKPTYRQWVKTLKGGKSIEIFDKPIPLQNKRQENLKKIKEFFKQKTSIINSQPKIKAKKIIKTIKRHLGKYKHKKSIGILIKNKSTRKKIHTDKVKLKTHPIHTIREYLVNKNLIKSTSNIPENLLRKIYQDSILSGDIYNKSKDIFIHNYMQTDT